MMPPLPPPTALTDENELGVPSIYTRAEMLAYGRAVAESCARLVETYPAEFGFKPKCAAAIREMAKATAASP